MKQHSITLIQGGQASQIQKQTKFHKSANNHQTDLPWSDLALMGLGPTNKTSKKAPKSHIEKNMPINPKAIGKYRQGDPLSPLLFIIVMDTVGKMLDKAVNEGRMSGFRVGNLEGSSLVKSHLFAVTIL